MFPVAMMERIFLQPTHPIRTVKDSLAENGRQWKMKMAKLKTSKEKHFLSPLPAKTSPNPTYLTYFQRQGDSVAERDSSVVIDDVADGFQMPDDEVDARVGQRIHAAAGQLHLTRRPTPPWRHLRRGKNEAWRETGCEFKQGERTITPCNRHQGLVRDSCGLLGGYCLSRCLSEI